MSRTVFITGASTGIGRATAERFHSEGWNVVATMRSPHDGADLASLPQVLVTRLDVTDSTSIHTAIDEALKEFGTIDVLVNNAGFGAYGALEVTDMEVVRRQFETNVLGLLEVTKRVIPLMREGGSGVIINVSSVGGRMTFPLGTLYHGSKFAVEGLSEALTHELSPFDISVKLIEPGLVDTDFAGRSFVLSADPAGGPYQETVSSVLHAFAAVQEQGQSSAKDVASAIFGAATDGSTKLRYVVGDDAIAMLDARAGMDDDSFVTMIRSNFGIGSTSQS